MFLLIEPALVTATTTGLHIGQELCAPGSWCVDPSRLRVLVVRCGHLWKFPVGLGVWGQCAGSGGEHRAARRFVLWGFCVVVGVCSSRVASCGVVVGIGCGGEFGAALVPPAAAAPGVPVVGQRAAAPVGVLPAGSVLEADRYHRVLARGDGTAEGEFFTAPVFYDI